MARITVVNHKEEIQEAYKHREPYTREAVWKHRTIGAVSWVEGKGSGTLSLGPNGLTIESVQVARAVAKALLSFADLEDALQTAKESSEVVHPLDKDPLGLFAK